MAIIEHTHTYAGWGEIASNLARLALQDSNKKRLKALEVKSEVLDIIDEEFKMIVSNGGIKIHSFQEARGISGMKGLDEKVVDDFSSKLDLSRTLKTDMQQNGVMLVALHNFGMLYADQGKLDEAEKMYQRALEGRGKALGPELAASYTPALNTAYNFGPIILLRSSRLNFGFLRAFPSISRPNRRGAAMVVVG